MGHNESAMATPSDAELVERARAGDQSAFGALYDSWFDRVYDLAYRVVRDGNAAADVAQDTFLAAWRELDGLTDPAAFGGWIRRIARNTALNRRKKDQRAQPVDTKAMAVIEAAGPSAASAPAGFRVEDRLGAADDPARAAEDAELAGLVWESADALGERDATVVDLQLRHDLGPAEIAEVIDVNRNHANQLVHRVRNRLGDAVRARVLWRGGEPVCTDLQAALADAGVTSFGPDAVRVATAHAEHCEECSERRRLRLEPTALFAATPLLVAPVALKGRIASALADEGVPMDGSAHRRGPDTNGGPNFALALTARPGGGCRRRRDRARGRGDDRVRPHRRRQGRIDQTPRRTRRRRPRPRRRRLPLHRRRPPRPCPRARFSPDREAGASRRPVPPVHRRLRRRRQ